MAAPVISSATVAADGVTVTEVWNQAVDHSDAAPYLTVAARGAVQMFMDYVSGDTSTTILRRLRSPYRIASGETVAFSAPASSVRNTGGGLQSIGDAATATNNSTQSAQRLGSRSRTRSRGQR